MSRSTARAADPVAYRIVPADPHAHRFAVTLTVTEPAAEGQRFALPAWIPGSYMIREFARHVIAVVARDRQGPVRIEKVDKHTWVAARARPGRSRPVMPMFICSGAIPSTPLPPTW